MDPVLRTLVAAARSLRRAPGTAVTAVATLAVGLSASVAVLGVLDNGLRPLPVPEGERVVQVRLRDAEARPAPPPGPPDEWALGSTVVAAGRLRRVEARLTHASAPPLRAAGAAMDPTVLRLLRVAPAVGRLPGPEQADRSGLVLGWDLWQAMGADLALLGTSVEVDGHPHVVLGVMPEGFGFPERHSFWTVLGEGAGEEIVARLAHGASHRAAAAALEARLAGRPRPEGVTGGYRVQVRSWTSGRGQGGEAMAFGGLAVLVGLLLGVCAANVATLLTVRATERTGVLAIHAALGASRARVGLQLFAEAVLVTLGGGLLGLVGGFALLRWMEVNLASHWGYFWMSMEVRPLVLAGTLGLVLLSSIVAGTAPALRAMRTDLRGVLAGSAKGSAGPHRRLGRGFAAVQVALSTLGLVAAVHLGVGLLRTGSMTARLPLERVAVAAVTPPAERYVTPTARAALADELRRELRRVPGARAATVSSALPGFDGRAAVLHIAGRGPGEAAPVAGWLAVDAHFAETYGFRLVAGRGFSAGDDAAAPLVALVTSAFARRRGAGVGDRIRLAGVHRDGAWAEVVGILEDWYPDGRGVRADRVLIPLGQADPGRLHLSVRVNGDAAPAVAGLRSAVARVDGELPVEMPQTLGSLTAWLLRMPRVISALGALGGLAGVLVAGIGLYGLMAFQVRTRLREVGIRMALGADATRILGETVREGVVRVVPGLAAGLLAGALATAAWSETAATALTPAPMVLGGVAAGMLLVGVLASLEPAARAARLDPQQVLRED